MLKQFEVTGFKNFAHTFSLDFSDVRDYRFNEHHIKDGMLKTGIIYGKNSTGKSNFGLALFDIVGHLTGNNASPGLYNNYLNIHNLETNPFVEFRFVFQFADDIIEYIYRKTKHNKLEYEHLVLNGHLSVHLGQTFFFKHDHNSSSEVGTIGPEWGGISTLSEGLSFKHYTGGSALKFALNNTTLSNEHPLSKMMDYVSKMLWFRCLYDNMFIGYRTSVDNDDFLGFMCDNDALLNEFQDLLVQAEIRDKLRVITEPNGKKRLYSGEGTYAIPFHALASNGTKALYNFFYWHKTASDTSLMFVDEFDAFYHFELSEVIVNLLGRMSNTQVLLTSHNTNLLSNRFMRPDCLFILTPEKLTSFVNATSRELREGHNLERLYMGGDFNE